MVERKQGCDTIVIEGCGGWSRSCNRGSRRHGFGSFVGHDGCEGRDRYRRNSHAGDCFFPVCFDRVFHDSFTFSFATNYLVFVCELVFSKPFQLPKSVLREFWFPLDSELDPARSHARRKLSKTWAPLLRIARFAS